MLNTLDKLAVKINWPAASTCLLLILIVGCNDYPFTLETVSGTVTLDGQPVSDAKVVFMPRSSNEKGEAGPYSKGVTNSEGRFELKTVTDPVRQGAVVGSHRIVVTTRKARIDPQNPMREIIDAKETIPKQFSDSRQTTLRFEVPSGGTDEANFELSSR